MDGGGGVDGDIEVAVVDNDEASLGQSETHIHHMYHAIQPPFFYCAQYCVSYFLNATDFTRSLRLCSVDLTFGKFAHVKRDLKKSAYVTKYH